ncbi:hypothetical protein [Halalkalicoccus salilacus]|uniref:hypothetical protein n=1 Tax=Halalkalicoccus sp. GCM10025704 TaxID=3252662 RepID=UPI003621496C
MGCEQHHREPERPPGQQREAHRDLPAAQEDEEDILETNGNTSATSPAVALIPVMVNRPNQTYTMTIEYRSIVRL